MSIPTRPPARARRIASAALLCALAAPFAMPAGGASAATRAERIVARTIAGHKPATRAAQLDTRSVVRAPRIVGGQPVTTDAFPFIVHVRMGDYACGGSLIHPRVVLTAGHCLFGTREDGYPRIPADKISVLAGTTNLDSGGQRIRVTQAVEHPAYKPQAEHADVALLLLAEPASAPVARLMDPKMPLNGGDVAAIQGWGSYIAYAQGQPRPSAPRRPELHGAQVPIVSHAECSQQLPNSIDDTMICAGYQQGGVDTCQGDSGGPIAVRAQDRAWTLIGVVSWGEGCAQARKPGVYAYLGNASVRRFIDENLQAVQGTPPATSPNPAPGPTITTQSTTPADTAAPSLRMSMTPPAVRIGGIVTARFALDENATIKIAVLRRARRNGRSRLVRLPGLIARDAGSGLSELRIRPRRVKRGATYLLAIQATDAAGNRSPILGARFRVR